MKNILSRLKQIEEKIPKEPLKVLVKNYSTNKFEKVLILPEELTRKYEIKTDN